MSVTLFLDEPSAETVDTAEFSFRGWIAYDPATIPTIAFHTLHRKLRTEFIERPDVRNIMPSREVVGFQCRIALRDHLPSLNAGTLKVFVRCDGTIAGSFTFHIQKHALASCIESALLT